MNRILTSLVILLFTITAVQAQRPTQVVMTRTAGEGDARMCTSDAGTINSFGPIIGQSNDGFMAPLPDTIFLCLGDSIFVDHNDDQDLSGDPNLATPAGIGYAFYDCPPTATGDDAAAIAADPCVTNDPLPANGFFVYTGGTLDGDLPFFNDGNLQLFFNAGGPEIFHFAPITFDGLDMGEQAEYEGNPAGECVSVSAGEAFAVAYLNEIVISQLSLTGCQGSFRVRGGLSELDNSDYPTINIFRQDDPTVTGNVIGGPYDHDDIVSFTVPGPGTYVIEVEDGKSCAGSAVTPEIIVCDAVVFDLPLTNMLPSTNNCVPLTVANFIDLISAQFSVSWDPSILSISGVQGFNPNVPDLSAANFSWQNFPVPNGIPAGVMGVSWTDNSFAGVTLPDDAIFFEICFDVVGQLGDCSPLEVTEDPVPYEVINSASDQVQLVPDNGKAVITENPFFVLLEQDSLTCPSFDDGSFTVTVDQGLAPYQFSWNTVPNSGPNSAPVVIPASGGTATVNNLPAGSYQVTITDATMPISQMVVDTVDVLSGPVLGITIRDTVPTCFGLSDGSIAFVPTSDGLPIENPGPEYTFQWSVPNGVTNPGNTFFAEDIPAGSYGITVTDPAGCQEIALIPLGQPPALRVLDSNTFISDASCTGGQDGQITITASGGTTASGNYTFEWSNSSTPIEASTSTISDLNPGQYCVTVTDDNGCSTEECYTVGAVKVLSLNENITDILCNGDATGEIFITGTTTGAPADTPYSFVWSANAPMPTNTPTTSLIENLTAGQYAVTMTDASAAGCQVIDTFTVNEPLPLDVQVIDFNNESCLVGDDGSITLGVSGGTGTYTYTWSHDATLTDSIATGLSAGNYTIDVEDANGCMAQIMQAISEPDPPMIDNLDDDSVTCADDTDGTLTVNVTPIPGTTISSIEWDNGMSGATIMNLSPGQYIVTVTADNACFAIDTALVTAPAPIALDSVQIRRPSCPGDTDGQISVFASGGTPPYRYDWTHVAGGPQPNNPITSLNAGDYTVVIFDANDCTSEAFTVTVEDPPSIVVDLSNIIGTSCPDDNTCDGSATATAMYSDGTTGTFVFSWASGEVVTDATTSTAVQLCEGTQTLTVIDGNSCSATVEFTIDAPDPIVVETTIEPVSCNGESDGSITLSPSGGTGSYTFFWVETSETTASIDGLTAGSYTAIITDENMCSFTQTVEVNEPDVLTLSIDPGQTSDNVTCAGDTDGVIVVTAQGGNFEPNSPYQFIWDNGVTGPINANLAAGAYSVTVTDFKGCTDELTFTIGEPDPLVFTLDPIDPPLCFGDPTFISIDTVFGGANNAFEEYTFMIDNNGLSFPVIQPATVFAGDHIVTVEDVNGCTEELTVSIASPGQITIILPDVLTVELGDSTAQLLPTITPAGNYNYQWTPAEFLSSDTIRNPFVFPERSLEYTLTVVNENGCTATETVFVELDANRNVYIPNIFSPNGDGINDEFAVFACTGVSSIVSARLFDRWGGLLVEETNLDPACLNGTDIWDGTKGGAEDLPTGVYVYMIEIEFLDGVVLTYRGDVTLIR